MYVTIDREFYYTADGKPYFFCESHAVVKDGVVIYLRTSDASHDLNAFAKLLEETEREGWAREYTGNLSGGVYCCTFTQVLGARPPALPKLKGAV